MPPRSHVYGRIWLLGLCSFFVAWASSASAATLAFTCTPAIGASNFRVTVDPDSGLVLNGNSQGGRRWAAHVNDQNVTWDEIYNSHSFHIANHFVLDRTTGALHGADIASNNDIMNAVCQKIS